MSNILQHGLQKEQLANILFPLYRNIFNHIAGALASRLETHISEGRAISQKDLAEILELSPQRLSQLKKQFEGNG